MTAARDLAKNRHERRFAEVVELDIDTCANTYGVAPCTAGVTTSGTAQAGSTATTLVLSAGASAVDDAYNGQVVRILTGPGAGQERVVADYVGASRTATVAGWAVNMLLRSEEFNNASWLKPGGEVVTTDAATAPDGTASAEKITVGAAAFAQVYQTVSATASAPHVARFMLKAGEIGFAQVRVRNTAATGNYFRATINLSTGAVSLANVGNGSGAAISIQASINGWWECFVSGTADTSGSQLSVLVLLLKDAATIAGTGNSSATDGIYVWGGQLRPSGTSSAYIKTTATAATLPDATSTYAVIDRPAACYNTHVTCQDKPNYSRTTRTLKFCSRGMAPLPGENLRPYITDVNVVPTEIVPDKGLAMRGQTKVSLVDESCPDHLDDPYAATRAQPAGGTFWGRMLARNKAYAGRFARVKRGFVVSPFDWDTFQTELYIVTKIDGPDNGRVAVTLQDPIKLLDGAKIPAPTDGKITTAFAAVEDTGVALAGGASTITLRTKASAVDDAYNGMEIYLVGNTGAGQRRTVTDYVGATRVATVTPAWSVVPDTTTEYEVSALQLTLATGKGAQYADPATSGKPEYVRLGGEVIRYTAKSGDVLSWPDSSYRAQFGTQRESHAVNAGVQLCRAFISQTPDAVIEALLNEGGLDDAYIDLAGLATEVDTWLSTGTEITAILPDPETASAVLADLLIDLNAAMWWDAVAQKARFKVQMPDVGTVPELTDDDLLLDSIKTERLVNERITQQAIYYDLRDAGEDRKKPVNYGRAAIFIDTDAESANEYADQRPAVRFSRWLSSANDSMASAWCGRVLNRLRDAPEKLKFRLDPRSEVSLGSLVSVTTMHRQGADGEPVPTIVRIVKVEDQGTHQEVEARGTDFGGKRFAFIAPNGQADYDVATDDERIYAYIADTATQKMPNGDAPYLIL